MAEFATFFVVLLAALLFPLLLRGYHVPWVVALIIAGIVLGPSGIDVLPEGPVLEFFGQIGVVFLMFMAGLETGISRMKRTGRESVTIAAVNGMVPFLVGVAITVYFGYDLLQAFIVGIVFVSSSVAVVLPTLERQQLIDTRVGTTVIGSTMIQDISSLLLLGAVVHYATPETAMAFPVFVLLLIASLAGFRWLLPKLQWLLEHRENSGFEVELRMILVTLLGVVVFYELIGLHEIVSGFLAGLFLSDIINEEETRNKIHAIGYGLFIPIFFIDAGAEADIALLFEEGMAMLLAATIVTGTVAAKYVSGYTAGRIQGFDRAESSIIGSTSVPQLSTAIAVAYLGMETGLLDPQLVTAVIALSVVTTLTGPTLIDQTLRWLDTSNIEAQTTITSWMRRTRDTADSTEDGTDDDQ